jgi:hypothetical protein
MALLKETQYFSPKSLKMLFLFCNTLIMWFVPVKSSLPNFKCSLIYTFITTKFIISYNFVFTSHFHNTFIHIHSAKQKRKLCSYATEERNAQLSATEASKSDFQEEIKLNKSREITLLFSSKYFTSLFSFQTIKYEHV